MENSKKSNSIAGLGVLTAISASLCCITPVLALFAGVSGVASSFSWLEPARPFFMGFTGLVLGFAWYQKLKPKKEEIDCDCETDETPSFWQSKTFLGIVTALAIVLLSFPYYSSSFYPENNPMSTLGVDEANVVTASLTIEGMTCSGCESHVTLSLSGQSGVIDVSASYEDGLAKIKFDNSRTNIASLSEALVEETGYKVVGHIVLTETGT